MSDVQRKLTTILAADAAGYSSVMEADEVRTLTDLRAARSVFAQFIARHHGRIANTAGDGLIAEFPSVVEAVQCAIEVQRELGASAEGGLRFRIGVHLGDVMVDGDDLLGEGVNLAARLQSMAEPGGILISQQVYDQVQKKLSVGFSYLGEKRPKNFSESVAVYSVGGGDAGPGKERSRAAAAPASDARKRFIAQAARLGLILAALFAIDWMTGGAWWVQWPAIGMALWLALRSGPLFERS
ncbi:MAG: adenylate/guanylate cyclase domain-containing protein [Hyphomonadaceae bacterium JAD_PAG50586_4]|nr:MAG: adenylate/guanylate cyclase domain-containing protein [Hyphomonadaceae bacterium JAD_PAG50586_4]